MNDLGRSADHTTIFRSVQRCAPEIDKQCRPLKLAFTTGSRLRIMEDLNPNLDVLPAGRRLRDTRVIAEETDEHESTQKIDAMFSPLA